MTVPERGIKPVTTETVHGPTSAGSVVLDLGADVGALILNVPAALDDREIEISRADPVSGADLPRTHSQVRRRIGPAGVSYAAIYPGLQAGSYTVWADDVTAIATVSVSGGQVTSCDWPDSGRD
jgi:hypothetical protein